MVQQIDRISGRPMPHGFSIRRRRRLGVPQLAAAFMHHWIEIVGMNRAFKEGASKLAYSKGFASGKNYVAFHEAPALRVNHMLKRFLALIALTLVTGQLSAFQKPKPETPLKPALTKEEKEILKNREMLENLDLLQDFEKFRFFDFFAAAAESDEGREMTKTESKETPKDEKKKK
jgi:hypothetical protein